MQKRIDARILKKLNSGAGVTILETLISMLIVIMVFIAVSTGISIGQKAFLDSSRTSQSNVLMESLITAVEGNLRYATDVSTASDEIEFTNAERNFRDATLMYGDGKLMIQTASNAYDLVPEPTYTVPVAGFTASQSGNTISMTISLSNGYSREFAFSLVNDKEISE